ncbi:MAG: ABC transporter permease [Phyllobacteriaceae bacterium]|nr:ABC transporter permease [Phyllobacteriaceae bacterium]
MAIPYAKLPSWAELGVMPAVNVIAGFVVAGIVVAFIGENPAKAMLILIDGALGSLNNIFYTLFYATSFVFTGLAVAVAFHAGLFNIGGEGQAYVGGLGVALVCLALDHYLPWWIVAPLAIVASALFGAAWAFIPGWLQAKRGSHIVITTIMFNFIASSMMVYLLVYWLKPLSAMGPSSRLFEAGGQIPQFSGMLKAMGVAAGSAPANLTLFLALAAAWGVWKLVWRTKFGYEMRTFGFSPTAATYAGISSVRITVLAMLISGGLAGMMAVNNMMGNVHKLDIDFVFGAGFVGIAVALMGRSHPVGVVLSALLFGVLYQGGAELSFSMPSISRDMILVIQALVILFAGALENLFRPLMYFIVPAPTPVKEAA